MPRQQIKDILILFVLCMIIYGASCFRPLWNPDETRYAEIAVEMVNSHDYTIPTLNYVPYFEKPIFAYWLTALAVKLFDFGRFSVRLPATVSGALLVCLAYFFAISLQRSRQVALMAAILLATAVEFAALSTTLTTDMVFSLFLNLTWLSFWKARSLDFRSRAWSLAFWAFLAFAFLTKGPLALILTGGMLFVFGVLSGHWVWIKRIGLFKGALIFALINLPWHLAVHFRDWRFLYMFYVRENFQAFFNGEIHHSQPIYFYGVVLLSGFFPWTPLLFYSAWDYVRDRIRKGFSGLRSGNEGTIYLLSCIFWVFFFFTMASAKLGTYILPAFPSLAIACAIYMTRPYAAEKMRAGFLIQGGIFLIAVIAGTFYLIADNKDELDAFTLSQKISGGLTFFLFVSGMAYPFYLFLKRRSAKAVFVQAKFFAIIIPLAMILSTRIIPYKTSEAIVEGLPKDLIGKGDVLLTWNDSDYSLPLYLGRRVGILGKAHELGFGYYIEATPQGKFPEKDPYSLTKKDIASPYLMTFDELVDLWKGNQKIFFFYRKSDLADTFDKMGIKYNILGTNGRTVLITNKA